MPLNTGFSICIDMWVNTIGATGTAPTGDWLLTTGFWVDADMWIDTDVWID